MYIIFYSMHHKIALPGWHHACSFELARVGHLGLVGGWRRTVIESRLKKRGMTKYLLKTMCTHSKWAYEQTLDPLLQV